MSYAMDFKAIWLLLRKVRWTWKAATGIQIQYVCLCGPFAILSTYLYALLVCSCVFSRNYVKPGHKLRGGKQGEDYLTVKMSYWTMCVPTKSCAPDPM
ncbi:hypothetical protein PHMEG_00035926 [Phytophthora megakarya]|uniref:Uncharacterized protein n=1 Tax=Phytophthora megakarya TaxID=4795 RepID=A0A225UMA1_9STRA|nr:hypothetical protein PHMEG_00035926 [Phytophthora megakarya]